LEERKLWIIYRNPQTPKGFVTVEPYDFTQALRNAWFIYAYQKSPDSYDSPPRVDESALHYALFEHGLGEIRADDGDYDLGEDEDGADIDTAFGPAGIPSNHQLVDAYRTWVNKSLRDGESPIEAIGWMPVQEEDWFSWRSQKKQNTALLTNMDKMVQALYTS
jgi:hypothetical protein